MRIVVMGAGAVGCYFGGLLARAGHDVTFIGRAHHVEAINRDGLLLDTRDFKERIHARATTEVPAGNAPGLVLFCVKSNDTETAGRALVSVLGPESIVLSLQNGVDNADRLGAVIAGPVVAGVVYVGAEMAGAGHVKHHGRGELLIGASTQSEALSMILSHAGIPTNVASDIRAALWNKLITNCAYNALSAIGGLPYGPLLEVEGMREIMEGVVQECVAVAAACGAPVSDDMSDQVFSIAMSMPGQYSSTAQDLARGKRTEIDFLNGFIVRKGNELGIRTPINRALQVMVKSLELSRAPTMGTTGT